MIKKTYYDENGNPCKNKQTPEYKAYQKAYRQKKTFLDENGNPCKRHQTPEAKAKLKAYYRKPETKARRQTPEYKAYQEAYYQTPEYKAKKNAKVKAYCQKPEVKAKIKAYHQKPEVKAKAAIRQRAYSQKPKYKAKAKAREKAYYHTPEGKAKDQAQKALRRAAKLQGEVLLNKAQRKAIFEIIANRPDNWHVDHIVPLQGETVSGLHLPENLQYLPKSVNCMKGNRWDNSWASHTMDTPLEEKIKAYQLS